MKTTIDLLIRSGTHLGSSHVQKHIRPNVYAKRKGRYMLNPRKTTYILKVAFSVIRRVTQDGGKIVFFTNNPSFATLLKPMFPESSRNTLITNHWPSGALTNWDRQANALESCTEKEDLPALLVTFQTEEARMPLIEAKRKGVPTIAIANSCDDPLLATYPIPGNTKGLKSFYLYARVLISALPSDYLNIQSSL